VPETGLVEDYLTLGLRLGRHIDGMVDAYYGPPALARAAEAEPPVPPAVLLASARKLLVDLEVGVALDPAAGGTRLTMQQMVSRAPIYPAAGLTNRSTVAA